MDWQKENIFNGYTVECLNLKGEVYDVSDFAVDWYSGSKKFNLFLTKFNGLFSDLVENVIDPELRIKSNNNELKVLSFISDETSALLDELIKVVNFSSRPTISDARKKQYREILEKLANLLSKYRKKSSSDKEDLVIVPMKGGSYFWNFLEKSDNYKNVLAIDCKRIPIKEKNSFGFGMGIENSNQYLKNNELLKKLELGVFNNLRIVELCIVSGMTTLGFLLFLEKNNVLPKKVEINTIALSQQGYEFISKYAQSKGIEVKFITGGMFYKLGNYYVSRRDELLTLDDKLVIGDVRSFLD